MKQYKIDMITIGQVTGIKEYGIFVRLDETTSGLIHISEISKYFVRDLHKFVDMNEIIRVKIVGKNKDHYQLSIKDIDYRIMKRKDSKIKETESGFKNLALNLDHWIEKKKDELGIY